VECKGLQILIQLMQSPETTLAEIQTIIELYNQFHIMLIEEISNDFIL